MDVALSRGCSSELMFPGTAVPVCSLWLSSIPPGPGHFRGYPEEGAALLAPVGCLWQVASYRGTASWPFHEDVCPSMWLWASLLDMLEAQKTSWGHENF